MLNRTHIGDCLELLPQFAAAGVRARTCVTSPPYFGLRDYGHHGQIGLEQTPDAYVTKLVDVFRAVRDCLSDDGTLWLNLGDSYAHSLRQSGEKHAGHKQNTSKGTLRRGFKPIVQGFKEKDLIGIPWRVAFALQADGWYLRQDIIWHKPNPMPESVRDRCTKAHEYVFLLSKSGRYYFDSEAIAEPISASSVARLAQQNLANQAGSDRVPGKTNGRMKAVAGRPSKGCPNGATSNGMRNRRSVWTVNTKPYKGAHFATFPSELIEPCILAGSKHGDVVLDPFMGSGTTAQVATNLGRDFIGCELNPAYVDLHDARRTTIGFGLVTATDERASP